MATKQTHIFKTFDNLNLKADIYTRSSQNASTQDYSPSQPIALFVHAGGFVDSNREDIPPHIVQLSLMRNWILVSVDYRKLPEASGTEMWEDVRDAFVFVRDELAGILTERKDGTVTFENVVLIGRSSGAYLTYLLTHNMTPKPTAILTYYGVTTISDPYFHVPHQLTPSPLPYPAVEPFFNFPTTLGSTLPSKIFDPACLSTDLSRNPNWTKPEPEPPSKKMALVLWLFQEMLFPKMLGMVDVDLKSERWRDFPVTVMVHGDEDKIAPYECSVRLREAIGDQAKLFTAKGQGHAFDEAFFAGDEGLALVEEAWAVLDEAVDARTKEIKSNCLALN